MTVIPVANSLIDETYSAVKLARYAQLIGLDENQFFGLNNPATASSAACNPIWTHTERAQVAKYLAEAQEEIEQVTRYPLYPRWFVNEQHYYGYPLHSDWGKVIDVGYRHMEPIHMGVTLVYASDPVAFFHATTVTDEDEIRVFHPNTEVEIIPSSVEITGGNVLITIPWARLVRAAYIDNPADGWTYSDVPPSVTSPYEATVDIASVHNNTDIEAGLVWPHKTGSDCCTCNCCPTCAEYTQTACVYVRNYETGAMDILPATYSGGTGWTSALCSTCYCADPQLVRINYRAGLTVLTKQAEDAVIRLAHSKMPGPPCGCGTIQSMWTRDRNIPQVLTTERIGCAFGLSDGAWTAWRFANAMRLTRGYVIG